MPPEVGACIGVLLCDALGHAHEKGIVHRDVKPENVLVELDHSRKTAMVKLTDFGIAKVIDAQGMTSTGQIVGSPSHMSPEQIDGAEIDARTDVFGLGVLVYECMVGQLPFEGKNPAQVLRKVLDGAFRAGDLVRPRVGSVWAGILAKAIAREPVARWESAGDLAEAMRLELGLLGISDLHAEVYSYLSGPAEYVELFRGRVVDKLVERAQVARSRGDMLAAASDLNRAVAYAPGDAALMQQLSSLAAGIRWQGVLGKVRRWAVVLGIVASVAVALFLWWYLAEPELVSVEASSVRRGERIVVPPPQVQVVSERQVASVTSARPIRPPARPLGSSGERKGERQVVIRATTGNALVSIDNRPSIKVGSGISQRLSHGKHTLVFSAPQGDPCCMPRTIEIVVEAGEGEQVVTGAILLRDARLSLIGGPSDVVLNCPAIDKVLRRGESVSVRMGRPYQSLSCFLSGSGIQSSERRITIRAGQLEEVYVLEPR